tara:strand:+ start:1219 stop:1632 length:414 start_codon:yes stop_codon:yes gene_type:complete
MAKKGKKKKDKVVKKLKEKKAKKILTKKRKKKAEKKAKKKKKAKKEIEGKDKKELRTVVLEKNVKSNYKEVKNISNSVVKIEKSTNFNVTIARDKIRSFSCEKSLDDFVKGDLRITINKAAVIRKRQINKKGTLVYK